jgi:hypothetical protein
MVLMKYDVHNPTKATRVFYDAHGRRIVVGPHCTVHDIEMTDAAALEYGARDNDIVLCETFVEEQTTSHLRPPLIVQGMHGLGDNLHQRGFLPELMERNTVYLESSWVTPYHDLIDRGLRVVRRLTHLRTQAKNAVREGHLFYPCRPQEKTRIIGVWYRAPDVRRLGSVLATMCETVRCDYRRADIRLPIPHSWTLRVLERLRGLNSFGKPIMFYRPLVERREWGGCSTRNPNFGAYAELYRSIRDRFFVVSVADLVPGVEWMFGEDVDVDVRFHAGELAFEELAALARMSDLVFCSPGFAVVLAQAVETPVACIFGGYDSGRSFEGGARHSKYLPIEPIRPCQCFTHNHHCDKTIDVPHAISKLTYFVEEHCNADIANQTTIAS